MVRAFSWAGFCGVFLMISPKFRDNITEGIGYFSHGMELYAPYSYILGVIVVLLTFVISVHRGAQPR